MGRSGKTVECVIGYNGRSEKEFKGWFEDFFSWLSKVVSGRPADYAKRGELAMGVNTGSLTDQSCLILCFPNVGSPLIA